MRFTKNTKILLSLSEKDQGNTDTQILSLSNNIVGGSSDSFDHENYVEGTTNPVVNNFHFNKKFSKIVDLKGRSEGSNFSFSISEIISKNIENLVEFSAYCVLSNNDQLSLPAKFEVTIIKDTSEISLGKMSSFSLDNILDFAINDIKISSVLIPDDNKATVVIVALFK